MAGRNVKRGLMYFRLDCDLFQDRKLKRLMRRWQNDGLAVYLALLCEIYRDKGYYIVADKDLIADIADTCLLDDDRTSNIFRDCIELGLFDRQLYEHRELLTSRGIQARYLDIMAVLRRKAGIDAEYSLISSEEIGDNSATIDDDSERIADSSVKIRKIRRNAGLCRMIRKIYRNLPKKRLFLPIRKKRRIKRIMAKQIHIHTVLKKGKGVRGKPCRKTTGSLLPHSATDGMNWPDMKKCFYGHDAIIPSCSSSNVL